MSPITRNRDGGGANGSHRITLLNRKTNPSHHQQCYASMARIDSGGLLFLYQFRGVTSDADSFVRSWAAQDPEAVADLEFELFWTLELAPKLLKAVSETIQSGDANRVTIVNLSDGTYEQTKLTQKCRPKPRKAYVSMAGNGPGGFLFFNRADTKANARAGVEAHIAAAQLQYSCGGAPIEYIWTLELTRDFRQDIRDATQLDNCDEPIVIQFLNL